MHKDKLEKRAPALHNRHGLFHGGLGLIHIVDIGVVMVERFPHPAEGVACLK